MRTTSARKNFPVTRTSFTRPASKILVEGGNAEETRRSKQLLGFVDANHQPFADRQKPEVKRLVTSGRTLTEEEEAAEYRKIVQEISPLVGDAGVSIEIFAGLNITAEQMLKQDRKMFTWIPSDTSQDGRRFSRDTGPDIFIIFFINLTIDAAIRLAQAETSRPR